MTNVFFPFLRSMLRSYAQSHPNRGSKWTHQELKKWSCLAKKSPFWNLIHKLKLNFMPVALLIFQQFRANTSFLSLKSPVSQQSNNATQQSCFSSNAMPKALNISLVVFTPSKLQDLIELCLQVVRTQTVNCIFQILFSKL